MNLVVNARDAMPDGGKLMISSQNMTIDASNSEETDLDHGRYVRLTVQDNGTGIPKENLPHIFDPFFTSKENGTGLGLSICQGIIENHGGNIAAYSVPGEGTTFVLFLPLEKKTSVV